MDHSDLVNIAENWLKKTKKCGFVLKEFKTQGTNGEIPDALGFRKNYSILIECKTTRKDFHKDKTKSFRINSYEGLGSFRFYLCPEGILTKKDLPRKWGLIVVKKNGEVKQIVGPKGVIFSIKSRFYHKRKCKQDEIALMYSALRRIELRGLFDNVYIIPETYNGLKHI